MATYPLSPLGFTMPLTGTFPSPLLGGANSWQQHSPGDSNTWESRLRLMQQLHILEPLLDMLSSMLGLSSSPLPQLSPTGQAPAQAQPIQAQPIQAQPTPAQPTSAQPTQAQPTQARPIASTQPAQTTPNPGGRIGPGSRVLVIGDSHTAGIYGTELDRQLRARGARVHTVGSSGASATHFITGRGTTVGYAEHTTDGRTTRTPSHATPRLEDLINQDRPDTIVVNLGANFRGASPAQIQSQVSSIGEIARRHGIAVKWVGPPRPRDGNPAQVQRFDQQMAAAVAPYGEYISSVPYTPEYSGPDGRHYGGARGTQLAQQWAQGIAGRL